MKGKFHMHLLHLADSLENSLEHTCYLLVISLVAIDVKFLREILILRVIYTIYLPKGFVQRLHDFGHSFLIWGEILQSQGFILLQLWLWFLSSQEHNPHDIGHDSFKEGKLSHSILSTCWQKYWSKHEKSGTKLWSIGASFWYVLIII